MKNVKVATNEIFDMDESSIPNAVLEQMFYRIANERQLLIYDGYTGRENEVQMKTMYASRICKMAMTILITDYERRRGKIFQLPD